MNPTALVVDDEPHICELLSITLQRMDITTRTLREPRERQAGAWAKTRTTCA